MNRKQTRDQNDISIIIGNLPKRLQKKIADETGAQSCCFTEKQQETSNNEEHESVRVKKSSPDKNQDVPQIDMFLRMVSTPSACSDFTQVVAGTPDTSRTVGGNDANKELKNDEFLTIPGILRVNTVRTDPQKSSCSNKRGTGECSRKQRAVRGGADPSHAVCVQTVKHSHPAWINILLQKDTTCAQSLPQLHDNLIDFMQRKVVLENWQSFCAYHMQLQHIFAQLLLTHLKFCCEQKIETYFWKLLFYNVIEYLKNKTSSSIEITESIWIINRGLEFYADLFSQLNEKYHLPSNSEFCENQQQHRYEFIAKVSAQKLLICLGDLSRYKSKLLHSSDFSDASNFYQRAQRLIPTNGIPYNQLAVLAIYNRKKFDAIYYHMRSLMSSNAICSARESLQVLFDEIRKKYEETEMKTSPVHIKSNHAEKKSKSLRKEVWIHPDGVRRLHRTDINGNKSTLTEEIRLNELSTDELLRRFTSLYLYVIGKLFTGIGMETVPEQQRKLLIQFNVVLKRNPLILSSHRLLKIAALNIFIMEHNNLKDTRREIRYHSFVFCNQMFGLILRKCNELFIGIKDDLQMLNSNSFQDLNTLTQFIKIWCDWLAENVDIWEPKRCEEQTIVEPWNQLRLTFEHINYFFNSKYVASYKNEYSVFEEDIYLMGFTPISKTLNTLAMECKSTDKSVQFNARLNKISEFNKIFRQHQNRIENKDESNFCLEQLNAQMMNVLDSVTTEDIDDNSENIVDNDINSKDGIVKERGFFNSTQSLVVENAQVSQLTKLKRELEAKSNVKKMYTEKLEEILKFVDTKLYIEVRPKYLLPDTNCFIDCLEDFEKLVRQHKRFILIIPLTVVKELDGLSKGVKIESYEKSSKNRIHHFDDVSSRAKKSLEFIKTTNNNVKCATTKGSIINASLFGLVEEEHVSNDDKILATALALSKTMSTETSKDGKCLIQTELVLVTTDRNLRVKALSRNLAVSELSEFQQWANECKS